MSDTAIIAVVAALAVLSITALLLKGRIRFRGLGAKLDVRPDVTSGSSMKVEASHGASIEGVEQRLSRGDGPTSADVTAKGRASIKNVKQSAGGGSGTDEPKSSRR